jgi:hypothetical protein
MLPTAIGGDPDLVSDAIGERRLEQRPYTGRWSGTVCPADTSMASQPLAWSMRATSTRPRAVTAGIPVDRRDAHRHRLLRRPHRAHGVEDLEREAHAVLERPPYASVR